MKIQKLKRLIDAPYVRIYLEQIRRRRHIKRQLEELRAYHRGQRKDFQPEAMALLHDFVYYATKHSPYYNNLMNVHGVDISTPDTLLKAWGKIPLLDKSTIRNQEGQIYTLNTTRDYVEHRTTGGSTGQPFGFYTYGGFDAEHQEFMYTLMGYEKGDRILALDGTLVPDTELKQGRFWTRKSDYDLPYGSMALSSHYLKRENIDRYIEYIEEFQPAFIRGYPSFIEAIARRLRERSKRRLDKLKGVQLTSESYLDYQIPLIEDSLGAKVSIQYGHSETSVFAYTAGSTDLFYCSPFYGLTEVINPLGKHVNAGEIGEVVVTGFNNYALPFIRYRTGDMAEYQSTQDGITRLTRVHGRTQDIVYSPHREEIRLTALIFGRHYFAFENIERWQIYQDTPGEVTVRIVPRASFGEKDKLEIQENFYQLAGIKARFEIMEDLPRTPRGKSKLLDQRI